MMKMKECGDMNGKARYAEEKVLRFTEKNPEAPGVILFASQVHP